MPTHIGRIAYPLLLALVVFLAWHWATAGGSLPAYVLPAPTSVGARLLSTAPLMLRHSAVTLYEVVVGFLLALAVGVALAWLIAHVKVFKLAMYPWLILIQVVPKVAIGPLLVVWVGIGLLPKILVSFLLAFFPVMIDTLTGLKSVQRDSVFLLRSMGAPLFRSFWFFHLPHALPHIFSSMKVAITLAVVGAVVGEFIGADEGLGYVMIVSTGNLDTVLMFVALTWVSVLSLLLYAFIVVLERFVVSWHTSVRQGVLDL